MFLKRLIIVIVVSSLTCYGAGKYFDQHYRKNFATLFFNSTDSLSDPSKKYDIILLGNSRIHFGLNPYYIDSITGLSSYNFAVGGSDAEMLFLNTSLYLEHHRAPAYAIIGSDISFLTDNKAIASQFHYLFYLSDNVVYNSLKQYHSSLFLARYIPFLKYSFFDEYNRSFLIKKKPAFAKFEHNIYKGFINPHKEGNGVAPIQFIVHDDELIVSDKAVLLLRTTTKLLTRAGTSVIFVSPPLKDSISKIKRKKFERADALFKTIADENGAQFLDLSKEIVTENKYFTDDLHLNEPGTRIFSRRVGTILKNEIDNRNMNIKKAP